MSSSRPSSRTNSYFEYRQDPRPDASIQLDQLDGTMDPPTWNLNDPKYDQLFKDVDPYLLDGSSLIPIEGSYPVGEKPEPATFGQTHGQPQYSHEVGNDFVYPSLIQQVDDSYIDPRLLAQSDNATIDTRPIMDDPAYTVQPMMAPTGLQYLPTTPGLTAIPGVPGLSPGFNFTYPDPMLAYPDPQPYYTPSWLDGFAPGHSPSNVPNLSVQAPKAPSPSPTSNQRTLSESEGAWTGRKRQRVKNEDDDLSEDDAKPTKPPKRRRYQDFETVRRESQASSASDSLFVDDPINQVVKAGEKPHKVDDKPWIRVNSNTRGETTRTSRINMEANADRGYKQVPLPNGNWVSSKYKFEYTSHFGLSELKKKNMSARQIHDYIFSYPSDDLRLWIQRAPADAARRYGSPAHSKCLFENCPKHIWGDNGTIEVSHYRIAFDEKFKRYGNKIVDPYDCTGFVHLYCIEMFLDFAAICKHADVVVDIRCNLPRESSDGKGGFSLVGVAERVIAQYFIKAAKKHDSVRDTKSFAHYPPHKSSAEPKSVEHMLVGRMSEINIEHRNRSHMRQFLERKLTPSSWLISKGDEDLGVTIKKIKSTKMYKKALKSKRYKSRPFPFEDYYDEYDPIINHRIAEWRARMPEFFDEKGRKPRKAEPHTPKASGSRKRKARTYYDSDSDGELTNDDDGEEDEHNWNTQQHAAPTHGTRTSPRKRPRVDYTILDESHTIHSKPETDQREHMQYQSPPKVQAPQYPEPHPANPSFLAVENPRYPSISHLWKGINIPGEELNIDDFEIPEMDNDTPTRNALSEYLALKRRQSSTMSNGPVRDTKPSARMQSSLRVRRHSAECSKKRQASFSQQPVSESMEFLKDDPPAKLGGAGLSSAKSVGRRASARLASKSG